MEDTTFEEYWIKFMMKHKDKPINWSAISRNRLATFELVEKYPDECWNWNRFSGKVTQDIVEKYPNKLWSWEVISSKADWVSIEYVLSHPQFPWRWDHLAINKHIPITVLLEHKHRFTNWGCISFRYDVTFEQVLQHPDLPWNMKGISKNETVTYKDVEDNPHLDWDYEYLSSNKNITIDDVRRNIDKDWCWESLSINIPYKDIIQFPNYEWHWYMVSRSPDVDFQDVLQLHHKPWCFHYLSKHKNITFDMIKSHSYFPWNWDEISFNPNITFDIIRNNLNEPWNFERLIDECLYIETLDIDDALGRVSPSPPSRQFSSKSIMELQRHKEEWENHIFKPEEAPGCGTRCYVEDNHSYYPSLLLSADITMDDINSIHHKDKWKVLSRNHYISLDIVEKNIDEDWDWDSLTFNRNLTIDFIDKYSDRDWCWRSLSYNPFTYDKKKWKEMDILRNIAGRRIHRFLRDVSCNPQYAFARKRLENIYKE